MIAVLIADDHAAVRAGVAAVLSAADDITVVGEAADGAVAVRQAKTLRPDVVLMDVRMPHVDGIEATRIITELGVPVLMLTTFAVPDYVDGALIGGASGYLLKTAEPQEIIDAVRRVAAGDAVIAPEVTMHVISRLRDAASAPPATIHPGLDELTPREVEILTVLGAGLSNADIAQRFSISEPTVKSHVSRLLGKLGVASRMEAAVIARDAGLS